METSPRDPEYKKANRSGATFVVLLLVLVAIPLWARLDWSRAERVSLGVLEEKTWSFAGIDLAGSSCSAYRDAIESGLSEFTVSCLSWSLMPPGIRGGGYRWDAAEARGVFEVLDGWLAEEGGADFGADGVRASGREWTAEEARALHGPLERFLQLNEAARARRLAEAGPARRAAD